jgi:hypothetical protein
MDLVHERTLHGANPTELALCGHLRNVTHALAHINLAFVRHDCFGLQEPVTPELERAMAKLRMIGAKK